MSKMEEGKLMIEWFHKTGDDRIVGEEEITSLSMEEICNILELDINDYPLIGGGVDVPEAKGPFLQKYLNHKFDFKKYDYQIECYARDNSKEMS